MRGELSLSGRLAARFQSNALTPLLALTALLLGVFAVLVTPREEEPQIDVTFANIFVPFPGAGAREVENLVSASLEQVLDEISGIKHVYSVSRPGLATLTVEFEVGESRSDAIIRLYSAVYSNRDWIPAGAGVGSPLINPKGIDDVPVLAVTLWSDSENTAGHELQRVAHALEAQLKRTPGTRDVYTIGGPDSVVLVELDPSRLKAFDLTVDELRQSLLNANQVTLGGELTSDNRSVSVQAGTLISQTSEIEELVVGLKNGKPVFLADVATIRKGPDSPDQLVWLGSGPSAADKYLPQTSFQPAVTIAVAKKPGTNAVNITNHLQRRLEDLKGEIIPAGMHYAITRNYGDTANEKALQLIKKLVFATLAVIVLVLFALSWRESIVVGTAIVITLAATLFASWAWGFTLNRVSLFALIFSIGILVDDAIVVVENIHRHLKMGGKKITEAIPLAVDEVGAPTILATFTVIAALLPMAFVSGLMGPYMSPIPINASMGMLISLAIALVFTPWLSRVMLQHLAVEAKRDSVDHDDGGGLADRIISPFLRGREGAGLRWLLWIGITVLIALSIGLVGVQLVVLKMLPFDNKSEFQVVLDMPEGTPLEETAAVLDELSAVVAKVPEVTDYQVYAGSSAPINFNGLVRQYYLRQLANQGDIQVNLVHKSRRDRQSHDIASSVREQLAAIGERYRASVKVVEIPPGPPVLSPLVAEIYGPDYPGQQRLSGELAAAFVATDDIVDIDSTVETNNRRLVLAVDRQKAALAGISQQQLASVIAAGLSGSDVSYLHEENNKYAVPIRLRLPAARRGDIANVLQLNVRNAAGQLIPLSELVAVQSIEHDQSIYHKDLRPVVFVTANMAGETDSPLYGMFDVVFQLADGLLGEFGIEQYFISQPESSLGYSIKWDGEWTITYETFRDMGIAYSVGLILIYLLVVGQFRSYLVPLIIMAPIPLTIIGVMPGHALLGKPFTATSMIGMIALAGIIVRNSILLVDFIDMEYKNGVPFDRAVVKASAVRAKPIILTALAAMLGAFFILDDPIFSGLAISLIFGILISTLLTLVVIPVLYYASFYRQRLPD